MEIGSESWCAAMSGVLAEVELPDVQATVEQRIGDGNGGPAVAYRLVIEGGRAHLEPAPDGLDDGDDDGDGDAGDDAGVVVMSQSRATAEAVRRGELGALSALQAGLIKVSGDVRVLIAAAEALAVVDAALGQALGGGDGNGATDGRTEGDGGTGGTGGPTGHTGGTGGPTGHTGGTGGPPDDTGGDGG
ncbi:hypothetical protein [Candidatus Poriferisodalis sp.]|uniref:hypothetical protein n=1 Tax=Candidatus Poriferisodalis sp. TaxID=3101277 RepID=UPI003B516E4D